MQADALLQQLLRGRTGALQGGDAAHRRRSACMAAPDGLLSGRKVPQDQKCQDSYTASLYTADFNFSDHSGRGTLLRRRYLLPAGASSAPGSGYKPPAPRLRPWFRGAAATIAHGGNGQPHGRSCHSGIRAGIQRVKALEDLAAVPPAGKSVPLVWPPIQRHSDSAPPAGGELHWDLRRRGWVLCGVGPAKFPAPAAGAFLHRR